MVTSCHSILLSQYNKLRKYRAQVISLEKELQEHKRLALSAKNKYVDWNAELQKKLKELRDEKKNWVSEEATLRRAEKETQVPNAFQRNNTHIDSSRLPLFTRRLVLPHRENCWVRQRIKFFSFKHRRRKINTK